MTLKLDPTQQTLLIPLYSRAVESRRRRPLLRDPKAAAILEAIDYDIEVLKPIGQGTRGAVLRTSIYDIWAERFLAEHPAGTIIEIGTGLNTRFERLDNGEVHWWDLDLPEVIELRQRFFEDTDRRRMIAASVLDPSWIEMVKTTPGPYFLIAEAVLMYLTAEQVGRALATIAEAFPGSLIAFDTGTRKMAEGLAKYAPMRHMGATMSWTCEQPSEVESLAPGLSLVESRMVMPPPAELRDRIPLPERVILSFVGLMFRARVRLYRMNLFQISHNRS